MAKLTTPSYVFRNGIEPPYFQIFKDDDGNSEIIHAGCAATMRDHEFPVYADDLQGMQCLEDILCSICDGLILLARFEAREETTARDCGIKPTF